MWSGPVRESRGKFTDRDDNVSGVWLSLSTSTEPVQRTFIAQADRGRCYVVGCAGIEMGCMWSGFHDEVVLDQSRFRLQLGSVSHLVDVSNLGVTLHRRDAHLPGMISS
jgi:hypothetical protein